ncbi:hypothetical protein [Microbacterium sp. PMB16]|uniref:hypothetical protein n=1 Tax=Microbacterium sp. PMB16 TaxID=3120157 RepID=UPI003F4C0315
MTRLHGRRMPRRSVQLDVGLFVYGIGIAFLTRGIARNVPLTEPASTPAGETRVGG